jgi:hypothetical protein
LGRPAERSAAWLRRDDALLADRGYQRCEHCGRVRPLSVSRCRSRKCPAYSSIWAGDTLRKIRENLRAYGGQAAMVTLTAPGVDAGLVWDRSICSHPAGVKCSGPRGCRVVAEAAEQWNDLSRAQWRKLNRVCKLRADRRLEELGYDGPRFGLLCYEWEFQQRGVWHLHIVLGLETALERAWAHEYVMAMQELAPMYLYGNLDAKPLKRPRPAEQCAGYIAKYLTKRRGDGTFEVTETVTAAGRTLLNYVSRKLTGRTGCTMRALRNARLVWASREGHIAELPLRPGELLVAIALVDRLPLPGRGP